MKKVVTLVLSVAIALGSIAITPSKVEASQSPFSDIKGHWAEVDILQGYNEGLINGFDDGTFRPNDIVRGDQFLAMMYRSFNDGSGNFTDEFKEQVREYSLYQYSSLMNAVGQTKFDFQNASKGYWAKPFVDLAFSSYLVSTTSYHFKNGDSDTFNRQLKREDVAHLVSAWLVNYEYDFGNSYKRYLRSSKELVSDMNMFSYQTNSTDYVDAMLQGVMNGFPDGKFHPQRYITRAEAITVIQRLKYKEKRNPTLPVPVNKYYVETADGKSFEMMQDKLSRDTFVSMRNLFTNTNYGATMDVYNMTMWFTSNSRKEALWYSLSNGRGFGAGLVADISLATTETEELVLSLYEGFDLSVKENSNLLNEALKIFSGMEDVSKLRGKIDDWFGTSNTGSFTLDGDKYEIVNGRASVKIHRYY